MKYTIDAQGKKIGRVASMAAHHLMGKHSPSFAKNSVTNDTVEIINASKVDIPATKSVGKKYVTYTGFRGGLNEESLSKLIDRRGISEVFSRAIQRMVPRNKLHGHRMKRLIIKE